MSYIGPFATTLFGRVARLQAAYDAHEAATSGVHGATSAATANRLITRDANGRAQVANPVAAADIANRGWVVSEIANTGNGVTQITTGTDLAGGPITGTGQISHASSGVTAGTYTFATITVNARGHVTAATSGSPVTSVGASSPLASSGGASPTISLQSANASRHGFMSSSYASKLDGIQAAAQVNSVTSVFGRTGAVASANGDYNVQQIGGITVSTSAPSGGSNGDLWFQV